ncbi:MAG TPA: cobyric acid synthase [Rhodospirillales bacterium]|jgi:adenosylcobyric acid synthase|nr:cobyric acid synthase [Rhodospirillales bacterium]HJO69241.1 cobyric acid synthase [Rhodospirillales bacterium]
MVQGTGSDVGKSLLVTGLCRAYAKRGLAVRPFKPQNMSNNAAVADDGAGGSGEIGRAQALQAQAARVPASVHMNPVLLKPTSDVGSQVIVQGRVRRNAHARDYHALKPRLMASVLESFAILRAEAELVLIEGAGSPSEVNLREGDIANMGFALAAQTPVILVGDIARGGVIANLVGTHALMSAAERALTQGYVINKFRGDSALFTGAIEMIRERTGFECFGVVPHFPAARRLPSEDAMALDGAPVVPEDGADVHFRIAVPRFSRIANFDDLDPLVAEPGVAVRIVNAGKPLPADADVIVLPGSKSTRADLALLRAEGWDRDVAQHLRRGGAVVGLCGGYQMLGRRIADPDGIEGAPGESEGLGLLDMETVISETKALQRVRGTEGVSGTAMGGYEMHMGVTEGPAGARPWFALDDGRPEGSLSADGLVMGSYLHGLFAADSFRHAFLHRLGASPRQATAYEAAVEDTLDALADHLEANLDLDRLYAVAQ